MSSEQHSNTQMFYALGSIAGLILLLVWMQGGFSSKTPPGTVQAAERAALPAGAGKAKVVRQDVDEIMAWPGTLSARITAQLAPKVAARIMEVKVHAGDVVKTGQVLVTLDERELQARLAQARSALVAAEAQAVRAGAEARRVRSLFDKEAATQQSLEAAQAAARTAEAQVAEARAGIGAAQSLAAETVLRAPFDGAVVTRQREPGDMALPGTPVLTLQSNQRLRVEAAIPASCAGSVAVGQTLIARVGEQRVPVNVEEVAPAVDEASRTVLVKAGLEGPAQAQPGAFVWLEQACQRRSALLVPVAAISRSGQLESVRLLVDGQPRLRQVRIGKLNDGMAEVLSGLKEGDQVLVGAGR